MEAEHPPQTDGHVAVAGEIKIDLQRIGYGGKPVERGAVNGAVSGVDRLGDAGDVVCQNDLFRKAEDKAAQTGRHIVDRFAAFQNLLLDRLIADNRPGDQLREEADVEEQIKIVALDANSPRYRSITYERIWKV